MFDPSIFVSIEKIKGQIERMNGLRKCTEALIEELGEHYPNSWLAISFDKAWENLLFEFEENLKKERAKLQKET